MTPRRFEWTEKGKSGAPPGFLPAAVTRDGAKLSAAVQRVEAVVEANHVPLTQHSRNGVSVTTLAVRPGFHPVYVVMDNRLPVVSSPAVFDTCRPVQAGKKPAVTENPRFRTLRGGLPKDCFGLAFAGTNAAKQAPFLMGNTLALLVESLTRLMKRLALCLRMYAEDSGEGLPDHHPWRRVAGT